MKLVNISETEFDKYASEHSQANFYQTSNWGHLKAKNGWKSHFLALKDENNILGATLLLSKSTPIKKDMFYAPRGFLIDYNNIELLTEWTDQIKKYAKEHNAIFIKIDPYVSYQERNINGDIVENGYNNKNSFNNLISLGYKHFGFNIMQDTLQPRWMFVTNTKNTTVDEVMKKMDAKTRQILHHNERLGIYTREIEYEEIPKFKDIMAHTGERREFIDRPLSYYQEMYKSMHDDGKLKIIFAEINLKDLVKKTTDEKKELKEQKEERKFKHDNKVTKMNEQKYLNKQKETDNNIIRVNKNLTHYKELLKENGDILTLGGILFLIHGDEVLSLVGGSYSKFMEFQSAYSIHFEGMKMAINNNYSRYNFYGIVGDFDESKEMGGLYTFKKSFGGNVVELLGEFDLIINMPLYNLYNLSFSAYHFAKNIKAKIIK